MSSLPAGFFDDETQQLVAEGVSLKKQTKNIENSLNNEVNLFLNEVQVLNNDETSDEKVQIIQREEEEEFIQLAYEAKLGLLQNKAAKVMNKNIINNNDIAAIAAEVDEINRSLLPSNDDEEDDKEEETVISSILIQKHKLKRKLNETNTNPLAPEAFTPS